MTIKTLKENKILENKFFTVYNNKVEFPNGNEGVHLKITPYTKQGIIILPVLKNGNIIFQQEFRYAANKGVYQAVKGGVKGETDPLKIAKIELEEELGLKSNNIISLGEAFESASIMDLKIHMFIAYDCEKIDNPKEKDDTEFFFNKTQVSKKELKNLLETGFFECLGTQAVIARYLLSTI